MDFSDESIFHPFGSDGMEWCWRKPGDCLDPWFTKKKVKHGNGKVVVLWGIRQPVNLDTERASVSGNKGNDNWLYYLDAE